MKVFTISEITIFALFFDQLHGPKDHDNSLDIGTNRINSSAIIITDANALIEIRSQYQN
jgi:hypothetical protein